MVNLIGEAPLQVLDDFLPPDLLQGILPIIRDSSTRKLTYALGPEAVEQAGYAELRMCSEFVEKRLGLRFNFAILKWYRKDDGYESGAYEAHKDPEELRSLPIVIVNLKGAAELEIWLSGGEKIFHSYKDNQCILLESSLLHRVSRPSSDDGVRYILFLGFRSE